MRRTKGLCRAALLTALAAVAGGAPQAASAGEFHWDPERIPKGMSEAQEAQRDKFGLFYAGRWAPVRLYLSPAAIFIPVGNTRVATIRPADGIVTGLAATPSDSIVVLAVTSVEESELLVTRAGDPDAKEMRIAAAEDLGEDRWFHEPMSLSPDKRWLVVVQSDGRRSMLTASVPGKHPSEDRQFEEYGGDLWVIDCAGKLPPRRAASRVRLLSCRWAPSAKYAVCELAKADGTSIAAMLLFPESGEMRLIADGRGYAIWSSDSETVSIRRLAPERREALRYHVNTGEIEPRPFPDSPIRLPPDAVWSHDGEAWAWLELSEDGVMVRIRSLSGGERVVRPATGATRLLGWSRNSELLAYVGGDDRVHLCVRDPDESERARLIAVMPTAPGYPAWAELIGSETRVSPVEIHSPQTLMAVWTERVEEPWPGPCLVYVDSGEGGEPVLWRLALYRTSYADMGDPREIDRAEMTEEWSRGSLKAAYYALQRYAHDHDGRLPDCETGARLAAELETYLEFPGALASPYGSGETRVRLLRPGENLDALQNTARQIVRADPEREVVEWAEPIPLLEMLSDDGATYVLYLDHRWVHTDRVVHANP